MRPARRRVILLATLRELEATLTDAAIAMFGALMGRAHLRARKRLEQRITVSGREGRDRLMRIVTVLETVSRAARAGEDIGAALRNIMPLDFHGRAGTAALRSAMTILAALDGDWRKPLPADVPLGHVERRWHRHVVVAGKIDRTHWEMATYGALANALASGDIWVPTSRMHRSLDVLLAPSPGATLQPPFSLGDAHAWLDQRAEQLDSALRGVARNLDGRDAALFAGERLRFPKEKDDDAGQDEGWHLTLACYGMLPATRITDVLSQVERWTGFTRHFGHVSTGLPSADERTFLATLIAEATNLGLSRMAEVCGAGSRRALLRMQTWHMREETFRAALACLTDVIHAEPIAAWFGQGTGRLLTGRPFTSADRAKPAERSMRTMVATRW